MPKGVYPRTNFGARHPCWKGDEASYDALHKRVVANRGQPQKCEECGTTEGKMSWCNVTGKYEDINDYKRMCHGCHQRLDVARRIETKRMTSERNNLNGGFRHSNRAKLTEEQVIEAMGFRKDDPKQWTYRKLGLRYGVTPQAVFQAVKGKHWKHLQRKEG